MAEAVVCSTGNLQTSRFGQRNMASNSEARGARILGPCGRSSRQTSRILKNITGAPTYLREQVFSSISLQVLDRNLQILVEYFNGHSPSGQFYRDKIEYIGLGAHFHF